MNDHDLVEMDAFERRFVDQHGAFLLRINHAHVGRCVAIIRARMDSFRVEPGPALSVVKRRAAA